MPENNSFNNTNETIEDLKQEIDRLKNQNYSLLKQLEEKNFGSKIQEILQFIDIAAIIKSIGARENPLKLLLTMTLRVVQAEASSMILFDHNTEELYFEEAVGVKAEEVKMFRLKPYEGIAGYSFTTGEAIAVADVMKDTRFKREISEQIHHKQKALMAAPLIYRQEVIGVMEAVNKIGGGTFSAEDLETFTIIANFSAIFLRKTRLYYDLYSLFLMILQNLGSYGEVREIPIKDFVKLSNTLEAEQFLSQEYGEAIEVAALLQEISGQGREEKTLAGAILADLCKYLHDKSHFDSEHELDWMMH